MPPPQHGAMQNADGIFVGEQRNFVVLRAHLCLRDAGYARVIMRGIALLVYLVLIVPQGGYRRTSERLPIAHGGLVRRSREKTWRRRGRRQGVQESDHKRRINQRNNLP